MKELSRVYTSEHGVELSARASMEWLQRAAKAGDPEAMYGLSHVLVADDGIRERFIPALQDQFSIALL